MRDALFDFVCRLMANHTRKIESIYEAMVRTWWETSNFAAGSWLSLARSGPSLVVTSRHPNSAEYFHPSCPYGTKERFAVFLAVVHAVCFSATCLRLRVG